MSEMNDESRIFIFQPNNVEMRVVRIYKNSKLYGFRRKKDCIKVNKQLLKLGYVTRIGYNEVEYWNIYIEKLRK